MNPGGNQKEFDHENKKNESNRMSPWCRLGAPETSKWKLLLMGYIEECSQERFCWGVRAVGLIKGRQSLELNGDAVATNG